ncbi:hypothetical protein [Butyrivibrio sp. MC2013]|uniref:hypothetical protein n=1 Tax=Butyrivibrio sp. MC2013 TaxID=1280686 RepID=UPI000409AC46|nr:hypothetical protein [Butyrivibrio sp. MC2013]
MEKNITLNISRKGVNNVICLGFMTCYVLLVTLFVKDLIVGIPPFGGKSNYEGTRYFCMLFLSLLMIHGWFYLNGKKTEAFNKLNPQSFFNTSEAYSQVHAEIQNWKLSALPAKWNFFRLIFKFLYIFAWWGNFVVILICADKLGYCCFKYIIGIISGAPAIAFTWPTVIAVLITVGFFLNYMSYYHSLLFAFFVRQLSKKANELPYNEYKPSITTEFRILVSLATRVSASFFVIAMIYVLLLLSCIGLGGHFEEESRLYLYIMLFCAGLPCLISPIIIFLLPKAFLNRIVEAWKMKTAMKLDENGNYDQTQSIREKLWEDSFAVVPIEIVFAVFSLIINLASFALAVSQTL